MVLPAAAKRARVGGGRREVGAKESTVYERHAAHQTGLTLHVHLKPRPNVVTPVPGLYGARIRRVTQPCMARASNRERTDQKETKPNQTKTV
jgi:hypothetical protein